MEREVLLSVRIRPDLRKWLQLQAKKNRWSMRMYVEEVLERERQRVERREAKREVEV